MPKCELNDAPPIAHPHRTIDGLPRKKYRRRVGEHCPYVLHIGQRKLLVSEIDFLTRYYAAGSRAAGSNAISIGNGSAAGAHRVLYVGAAPGTHLLHLLELFPAVSWVLYDPRKFDTRVQRHPRVQIHNDFFTHEQARREQAAGMTAFISDIRTGAADEDDSNDWPEIAVNMQDQREWTEILGVPASLKFRLPWRPGTTTYLDGDVCMQAWAPLTSTETRLMCARGADGTFATRDYDNIEYEEQCFHHNTVSRLSRWQGALDYNERILVNHDECYDCAREEHTLAEFAAVTHDPRGVFELVKLISTGLRPLTFGSHPQVYAL